MKILLTNPCLHYSHGHKFLQPDWPSLTLPYLAAIIGNKHEVRIVDNSHEKNYEKILPDFYNWKPNIIAFSIIAGRDVPDVAQHIPFLTAFGARLIAGGQGAALNSDKLEGATVFRDEAEMALPHYLKTGVVKEFERCNLNDSPIPRWDLMPLTKSLTFPTHTGSIEMSRGCPYGCEFCCIHTFWHSFRQKSNERILLELEYLRSADRQHLYLADDCFGMNEQKHMSLFDSMLSRNMAFHWFVQIRADTVVKHPEMIRMAARAGLYGVLVGFDSYDDETLTGNNKTTTVEINNEASRILRDNKIVILGSHIYGLPGSKSFDKTFEMGRKNSDIFAMPYFDGRPKIARAGYDPKYVKYIRREQFSLRSLAGLLHPNKAIRVLKRGCMRRWWNCTRGFNREAKRGR